MRASRARRGRWRRQALTGVRYLVLVIGAALTAFPLLWMVLASFKRESELFGPQPSLLPHAWRLANYLYVLTSLPNFPRYVLNSLVVTVSVVALNVFLDSLAAFAFSQLRFPGRKRIFAVFLMTMLIPPPTLLIPLYLLMRALGWLDTYWALIMPSATTVFGIFLVWQYMRGLPRDFLESARIDGASDFTIYRRIYLPLAAPALATLAVFTFITAWNDYLWPLVATSSDRMRTLPVGLAMLQSNHVFTWVWLMTGATISVVPVVIFYLFTQRFYLAGLTAGGIKG